MRLKANLQRMTTTVKMQSMVIHSAWAQTFKEATVEKHTTAGNSMSAPAQAGCRQSMSVL